MVYAGSVVLGAVALVGVGMLLVGALRGRLATVANASTRTTPAAPTSGRSARSAPPTLAQPRAVGTSAAIAGPGINGATPPLVPILAHGETTLSQGITATRSDSSVMVLFDVDGLRTRRRDKFEKLVRATLPAVYGRRADSLLAGMPDGAIAAQGDLLTELPSRGVHLALNDGWKLTLFPETRPGRDGPLVVRYRVAVGQ